jgi:palmitoyl-protein thioesterase
MFELIKHALKTLFIISICNVNPIISATYTTTPTSTPTTTPTSTPTTNKINYPIVVLHGLESSSQQMIPLSQWISTTFNKQVFNIEIGNGERTSIYSPMKTQLSELCDTLYNINELSNGFNFIGISQGGLLARGYVEQCNKYPVKTLITLVSPHGGIFWKNIKYTNFIYNKQFQTHLSIAGYWRKPTNLNLYLSKCSYLPIINNEVWTTEVSETQRINIQNLSNFVMVWSKNDKVLSPPESGKFSFYDEYFNIIPLDETELYKNDDLGLRFLNNKGGLHIYETNCSHVDHRNSICFDQLYDILNKFI